VKSEPLFADSDYLIRARVTRADIQLLVKYVESMGHLGLVTTVDQQAGEVLIQTTRSLESELRELLAALPLRLEIAKPVY
jgi:hypothetical protein